MTLDTNGLSLTTSLTVEGGILHLGKADTASAHINSKELMTFNIDTDNDDTNRYFAWYANGESGSGTELLRIEEGGNVGIGTTSPAAKLHIADSGSDVKLLIDRTDARTYSIYTNSTSDLRIKDEDAGADRITIKSDGKVGINTGGSSLKPDFFFADCLY